MRNARRVIAIPKLGIDPQGDVLAENAVEIWHESVRVYDVFDEDRSFIGAFYTDWHPREGKRGGAWMEPLIHGERVQGASTAA